MEYDRSSSLFGQFGNGSVTEVAAMLEPPAHAARASDDLFRLKPRPALGFDGVLVGEARGHCHACRPAAAGVHWPEVDGVGRRLPMQRAGAARVAEAFHRSPAVRRETTSSTPFDRSPPCKTNGPRPQLGKENASVRIHIRQIPLALYVALAPLILPASLAPARADGSVAVNDVAWKSLGTNENDSMPLGNGDVA